MTFKVLGISQMRVLIPAIMILTIRYAISVSADFDLPGPAGKIGSKIIVYNNIITT